MLKYDQKPKVSFSYKKTDTNDTYEFNWIVDNVGGWEIILKFNEYGVVIKERYFGC